MKKIIFLFLLLLPMAFAFSTERTEAATFYIVIDKSISMEESGAFTQVQNWLNYDFFPGKLTQGDKIVVYAFYGKTDKIGEIIYNNPEDLEKLISMIGNIKANGAFTDIGRAIETVSNAMLTTTQGNLATMLLLTDLKQEANWPSRFAGVYQFQNRYLKKDRITAHNTWFEIQVSVSGKPEAMAKQLYSIISSAPNERDF